MDMKLTEADFSLGPDERSALFLQVLSDTDVHLLLLGQVLIAVRWRRGGHGSWREDLCRHVKVRLLPRLLRRGFRADAAIWVNARRYAIRRCLEDEMRRLVGRLLLTHLALVADHWLVRAVLVSDELPFVGGRANHRVDRGVVRAVVLRCQPGNQRLFAQV